jgi:hypothetical protein
MVEADSFNNLGGKLSQPVDLVDLSDLSCLSTPKMETFRNLKTFSVFLPMFLGFFQTRLRSGKAFCFKVATMLLKYEQKAFEIFDASADISPSISNDRLVFLLVDLTG